MSKRCRVFIVTHLQIFLLQGDKKRIKQLEKSLKDHESKMRGKDSEVQKIEISLQSIKDDLKESKDKYKLLEDKFRFVSISLDNEFLFSHIFYPLIIEVHLPRA